MEYVGYVGYKLGFFCTILDRCILGLTFSALILYVYIPEQSSSERISRFLQNLINPPRAIPNWRVRRPSHQSPRIIRRLNPRSNLLKPLQHIPRDPKLIPRLFQIFSILEPAPGLSLVVHAQAHDPLDVVEPAGCLAGVLSRDQCDALMVRATCLVEVHSVHIVNCCFHLVCVCLSVSEVGNVFDNKQLEI